MKVRQAILKDAFEVSQFLEELAKLGKRNLPCDQEFVQSNYIEHADNIRCSVAEDENGEILGLQILKIAAKGNPYGVTPGWGMIGTHVKPSAARRGVGKALFVETEKAARDAGLQKIDATIGASNTEGLAYYDAMGFRTYKDLSDRVCKLFEVSVSP